MRAPMRKLPRDDSAIGASHVVAACALLACAHGSARDDVAASGSPAVPGATASASARAAPPSAPTDAGPDAAPAIPAPSATRTALGTFGVDIVAPATARIQPEKNERLEVYLSPACPSATGDELAPDFCVSAVFERAHVPAPSSLADALRRWQSSAESRGVTRLGEGVTPTGVLFALHTMEVSVGFRSGNRNVHTSKWVSRVYAALPVNGASHIACTGYVEHKTAADDADLRAVRDLCTSMRIRP